MGDAAAIVRYRELEFSRATGRVRGKEDDEGAHGWGTL